MWHRLSKHRAPAQCTASHSRGQGLEDALTSGFPMHGRTFKVLSGYECP